MKDYFGIELEVGDTIIGLEQLQNSNYEPKKVARFTKCYAVLEGWYKQKISKSFIIIEKHDGRKIGLI